MVSKSKPWLSLGEDFPFLRTQGVSNRPTKKIGLAIAEEEKALETGDTTAAEVGKRETIALLDKAIANVHNPSTKIADKIRQGLSGTKDELIGGEIDVTKARKILELYESQRQDTHSRKVGSKA